MATLVLALAAAALATELVRARAERDALRADLEDVKRRLHDRDLLDELRAFEDAVNEEEAATDDEDDDSEEEDELEVGSGGESEEDYADGEDYFEYTMSAPLAAEPKETPEQRLGAKYADVLASAPKEAAHDKQPHAMSRRRREISSSVPVVEGSYGAPVPQHNSSALRLYEALVQGEGPTLPPTQSPIKKHHRVSPLWSSPPKKYQPEEAAAGHRGGTPQPPPLITRPSRVMDTDGERSVRIPYQHHRRYQHHDGAKLQELREQPPATKASGTVRRKKLRHLERRKLAGHSTRQQEHHNRVIAAHFYGDSSNFSAVDGDRYLGNGRLRPLKTMFTDWTPSPWFNQLGMNQHFSYEAGTVTVKRSGLYLVYAQIYYLDEKTINGYRLHLNDEPVLQCTLMIHAENLKPSTCFTASVMFIPVNSRITLHDNMTKRYSVFEKSKSFFGLVKLGNARVS